jgi:transposase
MIEQQIRPFAPAVELVCTMTGFQRRGAQCIIGEIGADMTRFATARHLASWAGRCPGNDKSAGKRRSGKTRDGSKWLDFALEEAAMAAIRVKGHYLEAQYRRLKPRRGHKKAPSAPSSTQ